MDQIFAVKLDNGSSLEVKAPEELGIAVLDQCVFRRDFYTDLGEVVRRVESFAGSLADLPTVQRKATAADLTAVNDNDLRGRKALRTAHALVDNLKLAMKLLNAHYSLDGKIVVIQFSADGRVDFRELVKELSHALCTRIELRQIGVRDETGIYGGIGVCGQRLCCSRFLKEFNSINVKMAKEQDLSLTPSTISGICGRLKCCLKFEHEGYQQLEKGMPKRGEWCETPQGKGRIVDRNLLTQRVSVSLEGGNIVQFEREEITTVKPPERPRLTPGGSNGGGNQKRNEGGRERENRPPRENAGGDDKNASRPPREKKRRSRNNQNGASPEKNEPSADSAPNGENSAPEEK